MSLLLFLETRMTSGMVAGKSKVGGIKKMGDNSFKSKVDIDTMSWPEY